jgi:hypothetical protein
VSKENCPNREGAVKPPLAPMRERPHCLFCEHALRAYRWRGSDFAEGRLCGGYGDGLFCGVHCGYRWAVQAIRVLTAKGEG